MKIIIIGFGQAGNCAAKSLRDNFPDSEITVFDSEKSELYAKMRLAEYIAGTLQREKLILADPDSMDKIGIKVIRNATVESVDTNAKKVSVSDGRIYFYDKLVFASGADAFVPDIPGICFEKSFTLRTLEDADRIIEGAVSSERCAVLGGGLLGLEAAWATVKRGIETTVIESMEHLLPRQLDREHGLLLQKKLESAGLSFKTGANLESVEKSQSGNSRLLIFADGSSLETDMLIVSAGIRPGIALARKSGLKTGRAISVNHRFETSASDVYAVGDACEICGRNAGLWAAAKSQGEALGGIMAGKVSEWDFGNYPVNLKIPGIRLSEL